MADELADLEFRGERAKARIEVKDERGLVWESRNVERVTAEQDLLQEATGVVLPVEVINEIVKRRRLFRRNL